MLKGVHGHPYLDLEAYIDTTDFAALDAEICLGLSGIDAGFSGAGLRSMGWLAPSAQRSMPVDAEDVIDRLNDDERAILMSLSDDPDGFVARRQRGYRLGDASEHQFNRRQMLYLKYRHGVHFPWSVALPLLGPAPSGALDFTADMRRTFPRLVAFIEALPIGRLTRVVVYGLDAHHPGPVHRDCVGDEPGLRSHIILVPRGDKAYYLWDEATRAKVPVRSRAFWFNDRDYHGVEAASGFRYSIEVDGTFDPGFVERVLADLDDARPVGPSSAA